jgi:hypothetical protein
MFHTYRKVLVIAGLVFCLFSSVFAYSGGTGDSNSPYQIATVSDWNDLMNTVADWNKYFIMTADVNLQGVTLTPVGNYPNHFTGAFDGNSHIIRNADINMPASDCIGLFGCVGAGGQIRNFRVEDVNIIAGSRIGGLVGINYGTITDCYATGKVTGTGNYVGGLVGYQDLGQVNKYLMASHCTENGQEKLFLWDSNDGKYWKLLNGGASYTAPAYVVRDPSIFYNTADGKYYIAYTNNDNNNVPHNFEGTRIGIASSPDLITWTHVVWVNCAAGYVWAPEWYVDSTGVVHIFTMIDWLLKEMHPTVAGNFTAWSSPVYTGIAGYDSYIVQRPNDPNYYMFYVGGTDGAYIQVAKCATVSGTYTNTTLINDWAGWRASITPPVTWEGIEGPCIIHLGGTKWLATFQKTIGPLYWSISEDNWATWTAPKLCTDDRSGLTIGHGTVIEYPVVNQIINDGTITNCYATEAVTGSNYIGGLVGYNRDGTITTCYAVGSVTADSNAGGLIGKNDGNIPIACFWDIETSGQMTSAGGEGKTTAQMKMLSTFTSAEWDFLDTWNIGENQTYPFLRKYFIGDLNYDKRVDFIDFALFAEHWLEGI